MEEYYTKREYNQMKNTLTREIKRLQKQIAKLQAKKSEIVFTPDFSLDTTTD